MKFVPWFAVVMTATVSFAQGTDLDAILKKTVAAYSKMETLTAEGTVIYDAGLGPVCKFEVPFSIKLKKPNLYLISWTQTPQFQKYHPAAAIWSDGHQPYGYWAVLQSYSKAPSDDKALSAVEKVLGTIPTSLFFPALNNGKATAVPNLTGAELTGTSPVAGESCFVISGSSATSVSETFWISRHDFTIRKYSYSLDSPADVPKPPKLNEQQKQRLKAALKAMGQAVTQQNMDAAVNKIWKHQLDEYYATDPHGASTVVFSNINSPRLSPSDFVFKVPADATLGKDLFNAP